MGSRFSLAFVAACLLFVSGAQADSGPQEIQALKLPGELDQGKAIESDVWSYLESVDDSSMKVFEALSKFKEGDFGKSEGGTVVLSDTRKTLWVVIPVDVLKSDQGEWAIWSPGVVPLDIQMWLLDGAENILEHYHTGTLHAYDTRPIAERYFGFPLKLDIDGQYSVVFRIELPAIAQLQFFAGRIDHFSEYAAVDAVYWSVYIGLAAMMVLYSLFLFWITRRREFLIYGFYVVGIVTAALASSELLHRYLWPNFGEIGFQFVTAASFLSGAIACLFIGELLELKGKSPRLWSVFRFCIGIPSLLFFLAFFIDIQQVSEISIFWGGGLTVFLVSVCLVSAYQGSQIGRLLSFGWAGQLVGISLFLAHNSGWMPDVFWLDYSFLIGSSVEMLFFSLAIPLGIRDLIFEKDKLLEKIDVVSVRHEEGLQAASKVQQEIDQLKSQLLRERSDLLKLSDSYGRAKENLVRAETKLSQAEKLASLGQLIVGVSADLGAKASEVNQSIADLSKSLDRFVEDYVPASEELSSSEHVVTDLRRLFVFVEKGAGSILRMNQALNHYSAGESQPMATEILSDVFEDVRLIVHGRIRQHRLEVNIPDNLRLMCRRSQVERVLGNLLTNASDGINDSPPEIQGDEGDGLIRVIAQVLAQEGQQWISVTV